MNKILVVEDDKRIQYSFLETLGDNFEVHFANYIKEAKEKIKNLKFDLIFIDIKLPDGNGLCLLEEIVKNEKIPVCVISGYGKAEGGAKAIKLGAVDFIEKPIRKERLKITVQSILRDIEKNSIIKRLSEEIRSKFPFIGRSNFYKEVMKNIEIFSNSNSPLLITGETGVGKDVIARYIHYVSVRKNFPFEYVNCASIPRN